MGYLINKIEDFFTSPSGDGENSAHQLSLLVFYCVDQDNSFSSNVVQGSQKVGHPCFKSNFDKSRRK